VPSYGGGLQRQWRRAMARPCPHCILTADLYIYLHIYLSERVHNERWRMGGAAFASVLNFFRVVRPITTITKFDPRSSFQALCCSTFFSPSCWCEKLYRKRAFNEITAIHLIKSQSLSAARTLMSSSLIFRMLCSKRIEIYLTLSVRYFQTLINPWFALPVLMLSHWPPYHLCGDLHKLSHLARTAKSSPSNCRWAYSTSSP
jgi:hypothetical protein